MNKPLRLWFRLTAILLLVVMLFASWNAGISCDEILHYGQSVKVFNYFASGGADKSALADTDLNLKYYGQSYDNFVTFVTKLLHIRDIYLFRHLMSAVMGWLTILITALFARWLFDEKCAIITLLLFAVSPFFIGHSYNNLKDIPFAFAYISGIWMTFRFLGKSGKIKIQDAVLLTLSIAFCISIRAGGLILICYLFLFLVLYYTWKWLTTGRININEMIRKTAWIFVISLVAFLLSSLQWPYALQDPFRNIISSYKIMAHYPATFRQLFEGVMEWSDYMPWYYLPKSMFITIPLTVIAGFLVSLIFSQRFLNEKRFIFYVFLAFTIAFPLLFVIILKSNLYSSWRQFLFVYPGIVILSAAGINFLLHKSAKKYAIVIVSILLISVIGPVRFMIKNHPYEYIYYNELAGGVKNTYGNYELDYYYTSQTEASEWLINYIKDNNITGPLKVSATYSVSWLFRNYPDIKTSWMRFEERSMADWDYAIVVNRYIPPYQLKNGIWPPENAIHTIYVDNVPVCSVLQRKTKDDYAGYQACIEGNYSKAAEYFKRALKVNNTDEMIFYNFGGVLYKLGDHSAADSILKEGLKLNPGSENILMYLGNISSEKGMPAESADYYQKVIESNRKYFEAYVKLSGLFAEKDVLKARKILRDCLIVNPEYVPAILALGDTYRGSNPEIAEKYYEQAKKFN
ncbi:MAG TPA: hypothetical protein VHO46_09945 [Bacteroidales bacterium]|nr:hypothetical protein [Bacteroidales bacterium]